MVLRQRQPSFGEKGGGGETNTYEAPTMCQTHCVCVIALNSSQQEDEVGILMLVL